MYGADTNAQGSKFDLAVKTFKRQSTIIILAILVDLPSPMICAKIQPQGILGSGEVFEGYFLICKFCSIFNSRYNSSVSFWRFLIYMDIAAILVNGSQPFLQFLVTLSQEGSTSNLSDIGPAISEEKLFEIRNIFPIQMYGAHKNA